jgi:DNA adenine methylase
MKIDAPFVWFGGKSRVADVVWRALGNPEHYIEPFFGSGAVLLGRPHAPKLETINDFDGMVANFWRAVSASPSDVASHAAHPVNEADLHARHLWLVNAKPGLTERLMADPEYCDTKAAGWWVWGLNSWIGGGFCSGDGPWQNIDGVFAKPGDSGRGVKRKLPHLGGSGQGVNRQLPHLGDRLAFLTGWFDEIRNRMSEARVACGDWSRVCGNSVITSTGGITGMFFDPPYDRAMRADVYANESDCAKDVLEYCAQNGGNRALRIVLAGYDGEHNRLESIGWRVFSWKSAGGYGGGRGGLGEENSDKERLWFSPHCLDHEMQKSLF